MHKATELLFIGAIACLCSGPALAQAGKPISAVERLEIETHLAYPGSKAVAKKYDGRTIVVRIKVASVGDVFGGEEIGSTAGQLKRGDGIPQQFFCETANIDKSIKLNDLVLLTGILNGGEFGELIKGGVGISWNIKGCSASLPSSSLTSNATISSFPIDTSDVATKGLFGLWRCVSNEFQGSPKFRPFNIRIINNQFKIEGEMPGNILSGLSSGGEIRLSTKPKNTDRQWNILIGSQKFFYTIYPPALFFREPIGGAKAGSTVDISCDLIDG